MPQANDHLDKWRKMLKRLVLDPDGRTVLKEHGIEIEVGKDAKPPDIPIVAVLCPTYRNPEALMRDSLGAMMEYTRQQNAAIVYMGKTLGSSVVHWSRNMLISEQIKSGKPWTHVLFIDDDIVVQPDSLCKLLSHKKDITAGLCTRRQDPPIPNMRSYDEKTADFKQIWDWPQNSLYNAGGVGTGFILLSRHALEQVGQAYMDCLYEQEFFGLSGERLEGIKAARVKAFDEAKQCYWYRFLPGAQIALEYGEDMGFCLMARRYCGMDVWVDTSVQPGHLGPYPFSVRDFEPHREACVLEAKLKGQYPMEVPDMKISILCPTRGRPENIHRLLKSIRETANQLPEIVFYLDQDDTSWPYKDHIVENVTTVYGPRITLSECWNKCAEVATGEILMHAGDDIVFKTKGWDDMVRRAFTCFDDRLVFVHGDDGVYGSKFGTHGFLHRAWVDATGYFCPPYFSSDYNDTWFNEVFNAVNRRIPMPFLTEHMHPAAGKAEWDKTHKERLERHKKDNVERLYKELASERLKDVQKISALMGKPYQAKKLVELCQ